LPIPSLSVDWREFQAETARLQVLCAAIPAIDVAHRKLVAEIAMIRLFLLIENTIGSIGAKMLCGARYLDTTQPLRTHSVHTIAGAVTAMKSHGRTVTKNYLKWTKSADIRDNLSLTLAPTDPFFATIIRHAADLNEMRKVRNHIAHKSHSTRVNFRNVVTSYYGGLKQGVTPGLLLLTDAFGAPCLLDRYLIKARVIIKDTVRA
jgi:hypothetical protein